MNARTALRPGVQAWIQAARPPTLPAAVVPVAVGTALAHGRGQFHVATFIATLAAALLIQIGTNLANDYSDFQKGADTPARLGPLRITASGIARPESVWRAAVTSFSAAALVGVYLITIGGWPILVIGAFSILAGVGYTGGRFAFGYYGLGDVVCFVFFGIIAVTGTYYLQIGSIAAAPFVAAVPVACLVTAILAVNNVRDVNTDRASGKRTLAVLIGRSATRAEYAMLLMGAYLWLPVVAVAGDSPWWLFWLPVATIPMAITLIRVVSGRVDGPSLNVALKGTGQLHLFFGALFALSLLR